jgi:acyl carrier protein
MGLDSVDLIKAFEKGFDITIPDPDAEKLTTVGAVYDYIWDRIEKKHSSQCNSQILFYKLRRAIVDQTGVPIAIFTPATLMNEIIPWKNRKKEYSGLENRLQLNLPELSLSATWDTVLTVFGFIAIPGGLIYSLASIIFLNKNSWMLLYPAAGIVFILLFSLSLNPKRTTIRPYSLKDFARKTLTLNYGYFAEQFGTNRKDVESVINEIIVNQIGVDPQEICPGKSFTDDLGVY